MKGSCVIVEVWDKDLTGRGDFLGRVVLEGPRTILSQPSKKQYHKLEPRPDKSEKYVAGRLALTAIYEDREYDLPVSVTQ